MRRSKWLIILLVFWTFPTAQAAIESKDSLYIGAFILAFASIAFVIWAYLYLKRYSKWSQKPASLVYSEFVNSLDNYLITQLNILYSTYKQLSPEFALRQLEVLLKLSISKTFKIPFKNNTSYEMYIVLKERGVDEAAIRQIYNALQAIERLKYTGSEIRPENTDEIFRKVSKYIMSIYKFSKDKEAKELEKRKR